MKNSFFDRLEPKHKMALLMALTFPIILAWVGMFFLVKDGVSLLGPLGMLTVFVLLKFLYFNVKFVNSYARLVGIKAKVYWYIPVVMEFCIFSPLYAKLSLSLFIALMAVGILVYLVNVTGMSIPFIDPANQYEVITDLIWVTIGIYLIYNVVVALGYLKISDYIEYSYYKNRKQFVSLDSAVDGVWKKWTKFMYFLPLGRATAMISDYRKADTIKRGKRKVT